MYASGGLNPQSEKAEQHAEMMYLSIRKRKFDCINIANNSGIPIEQISLIKAYLFSIPHDLGYGFRTFHPSFEIAESWKRLSGKGGNHIQRHDIILLYHERLEIQLLLTTSLSQIEAHIEASKKFNYQLECNKFYEQHITY